MPTLSWLGDAEARRRARRVPYRILQPTATIGDPAAQNLLIQGDNLEALKALLPFYARRVKCVFIDPPYNTRSAFEHYDDNLEHSQWLSMMYPRLELLRDLLSEDGSIWVTIDDNEGQYLKVLMDEVFGRARFVANCVWQKRYARDNAAPIGSAHDNLLVYAINGARFRATRGLLEPDERTRAAYRNPNNDPDGPWQSISFTGAGWRPNQMYRIVGPDGTEHYPPEGRHWATLEPEYERLRSEGRFWFGANGSGVPRLKRYLSEVAGLVPLTWWPHAEAGHNDEAKKEIHKLFGRENVFDTPKPERLLQRILTIGSKPGDIVLDSFLGSGTTAAVAHKMGRRWIGIEMGEHAMTHCVPRLKKVVEGEQGGISEAVGWKGGGGLRVMTLGGPVFRDDGRLSPEVKFKDLAAYLWFLETRLPHPTGQWDGPFLGTHDGVAYFLLFNGVLSDLRANGGNVLTTSVWSHIRAMLPPNQNGVVVFGEACRLSSARLHDLRITFRQIPYQLAIR